MGQKIEDKRADVHLVLKGRRPRLILPPDSSTDFENLSGVVA